MRGLGVAALWWWVGTASATVIPLGWIEGERQAYFLIQEAAPDVPQPVLLGVFHIPSGAFTTFPLVELGGPFCRQVQLSLPDPEDPGEAWMEGVKRKLKPFHVQADHTLSLPGTKWRMTVGDRLKIIPPIPVQGVAMAGQIYTIEVAKASRPGLLTRISQWVEQAGYLPYVMRVSADEYSLRTGCFIGEATAQAHAKRLAKTLGLVGVVPTNRHEEYREVSQVGTPWLTLSGVPVAKGTSPVHRWWFWMGLTGVVLAIGVAFLFYLRLGGDADSPQKP